MKVIFNIHNRRNTGPTEKVIELVVSLKNLNPKNEYSIFCTSDHSRLKIEKETYKHIQIICFPDLLFGKLRQGIDLYNSLVRIFYLIKHNHFDILHSIDARPVVAIPSLFSKIILKKILFLNWWDFSGKGGISEQKFGFLYSRTFGLIEYYIDRIMRKISDVNLVVSKGLLDKIERINPSAKNYLIRVGANEYNEKFKFNFDNLKKYEYIFYCGALSKEEKSFVIQVSDYLNFNNNFNTKIVIAGTNIKTSSPNLISLGRLNDFQEIMSLIYYSKFCLLPLKNNVHNNLRWPSKISDYCSLGKAIVSTPLEQLNYNQDFCIFSTSDSVEDYANEIYNAVNMNSKTVDQFEQKSFSFFERNLSNKKISVLINSIYYDSVSAKND